MRVWIPVLMFGIALFAVVAPARADQTMRCPTGRLVRVGDRLLELARICGAPDLADQHTVLREVGSRVRRGSWEDADRVVIEVRIDEWLYDMGPGRLVRRLVFEDGRLVRIDTLGRGRR